LGPPDRPSGLTTALLPEKILVIRLSSLGDVVLVTPALRALRERFPKAVLHVATRSEYAPLVHPSPWVNAVQALERSPEKAFLSYLKAIKKERYDLVIDLHATLRSRMIAQASGAGQVLRYSKAALGRRMLVAFKARKAVQTKHVVDRYLRCLWPLGINGASRIPEVALNATEKASGRKVLEGKGPWIALVPGARHATKQWLKEGFVAVGKKLWQEDGIRSIVLGSKAEKALVEGVAGEIGEGAKPASGLGLREMAAVLASVKAVVTNDSGPMHLATAVGTRVVALFGPTVEAFGFFPIGERNIVLQRSLYCRPCSLHGTGKCPEGHFRCMKEITPREVLLAVRERFKE
jgi:heptosyltransferase-2